VLVSAKDKASGGFFLIKNLDQQNKR